MKKYNENIDFIITAYNRIDYIKLLEMSIEKYTNFPYKIIIVCDVTNDEQINFYKEVKYYFKEDNSVTVLEGNKEEMPSPMLNHTNTINPEHYKRKTKIDGRVLGYNSFYKSDGIDIGIKNGNGRYVCLLDTDTIFLNEWVDGVLKLLDDNLFVSAMWRSDISIARDQFLIYDRKRFDSLNLIPNCDYKDTSGNLTLYAEENNIPFYTCKNSSPFDNRGGNANLKSEHLIDLGTYDQGEQIYVDEKPFFYHHSRGSYGTVEESYDNWKFKVSEYLEKN